MARVTRKELNECIAEAIASYIREGWEDDVVNAALKDKGSKAAAQFMKDFSDEKSGDSKKEKKEAWTSRVKEMDYDELVNIKKSNPTTSAAFIAANSELCARNEILKDKKDILSGEMIMPYGWEFNEEGYPVRKHIMKNDPSAWMPSGLSSRAVGGASSSEVEECISEAIARVLKEDVLPQSYFDDYIDSLDLDNPNRKKTAAERAFEKDAEKDAKAKEEDDEKLAAAEVADAAVETDEEGNAVAKAPVDVATYVKSADYVELFNCEKNELANGRKGSALQRAAKAELMARNRVVNDNTDIKQGKNESDDAYLARVKQISLAYKQAIESGEIYGDYGFTFDENGYPMRKHLFNNEYVDNVDMSNAVKANFHMLKNRMSAKGGRYPKTAFEPEIGMQDASWA